MGNIPTKLQTSLSGKSWETYFVEGSDLHHGTGNLYKPFTKRITLRYSFKYIDVEPTSTTYIVPKDVTSPLSQIDKPPHSPTSKTKPWLIHVLQTS
jgi:hypothetical protein